MDREVGMEERRQHPRFRLTVLLDLYTDESFMTQGRGCITNLSVGGCAIETKRKFSMNTPLILRFGLSPEDYFDLKGEIVRIKHGVHTNFYGVRFTRVGFFQKLRLKKYVLAKLRPI